MQVNFQEEIPSPQSTANKPLNYDFQQNDDRLFSQEQLILQRVIAHSMQEQARKFHKNGLSERYRKMLTNLKMVKSNQKCTVCLQAFTKDEIIKKLPCKHIFHRGCAKSWFKVNKKCPVCRLDLEEHFTKIEETKGEKEQKFEKNFKNQIN